MHGTILGAQISRMAIVLPQMRHFRLSASGGHKRSVGALIACVEGGLLRHGDLAEALQAFYLARGELESEDRDQYMKRLMKKIFKATGSVDTLVT